MHIFVRGVARSYWALQADIFVTTHCKQFSIYVFPKRLSQDSISTKYFCLEYAILDRSTVLDAALHLTEHSEQHISKWNYEISVAQEIHISRLDLQIRSVEFVISLCKVYIRDLALRFGYFLLGSCNSNLNYRQLNFQYIFSQLWKLKIFCGNMQSL